MLEINHRTVHHFRNYHFTNRSTVCEQKSEQSVCLSVSFAIMELSITVKHHHVELIIGNRWAGSVSEWQHKYWFSTFQLLQNSSRKVHNAQEFSVSDVTWEPRSASRTRHFISNMYKLWVQAICKLTGIQFRFIAVFCASIARTYVKY